MEKVYDLHHFVNAHEIGDWVPYSTAYEEICRGRKESHWIWYIFPQMRGLGSSFMCEKYGISGLEEAKAFLEHPYLGAHLREITQALLHLETNRARDIMDPPDDKKLKSSMTLFALAAGEDSVFHKALDKFFEGAMDKRTLKMLNQP